MLPAIRHSAFSRFAVQGILYSSLLLTLSGCAGAFTPVEDPQEAGLRLYAEKNYPESAGAFRNALKEDPRDYTSRYLLAVSLDAMGAYHESIESYKTTLDTMQLTLKGRTDVDFRLKVVDGLAVTVAKSDPHDTQINTIESQAKTTQRAEDYFLLAKIYKYRGDPDMAMENYQHALLLDGRSFAILKEYGLYLEQLKQKPRAIATLEQAYRLKADDQQVTDALRRMGIIPGPSIKDENQLALPLVPRGPIPPVDVQKLKDAFSGGGNNTPAGSPTPAASIQAPRE